MALMLYAAVIPLVAILLLYPVYAPSNTPYLETVYNHSIIIVLSPVVLKSVIINVLDTLFSLSSRAYVIRFPPPSNLLDSFSHLFTQDGLNAFVTAAQWATDKLFTLEISHVLTVVLTFVATKFFQVAYVRIFISAAALIVTAYSVSDLPTRCASLHAAEKQFLYRIFALCSITFTAIDYAAIALNTLSTLHRMSQECDGLEGSSDCDSWWDIGSRSLSVVMVVVALYTVGTVISIGVENVRGSWRFVGVAWEKEASEKAAQVETIERALNVMKRSGKFIEIEREEQMKEEVLQEIIRLYDVDETQMRSSK